MTTIKMKTVMDFLEMPDHLEIDHYTINELKNAAIESVNIWRSNLSEGVWIKIDGTTFIFESKNIKKDSDHVLLGSISAFCKFFCIDELELNKLL